ncbi:MAG: hypothetical protein AUH11_12165 [Acidobacteria bacterium 13_2_20CM_57_17]|nr:MAG: hypothetical protein AUH11_12165 [Acidobacteria bacterium 13_2_20CM_57_17]OLB95600.1 MAG: hypothetical protein AUI02_03330 [Acidobacteria bacterium 13_2_20CM_2_57_12]
MGGVARLVDDWPEAAGGLARNGGDSGRGDDVRPEATSMVKTSSKQAVAAMRKNLVNKTPGAPGGVWDLWQRNDLKCGHFGSVARKRVTGEFLGCVANEGVKVFDAGGQRGMRGG